MELKVVKDLKVTILVDNYIDVLLPSSEGVVRPPVAVDGRMAPIRWRNTACPCWWRPMANG